MLVGSHVTPSAVTQLLYTFMTSWYFIIFNVFRASQQKCSNVIMPSTGPKQSQFLLVTLPSIFHQTGKRKGW